MRDFELKLKNGPKDGESIIFINADGSVLVLKNVSGIVSISDSIIEVESILEGIR